MTVERLNEVVESMFGWDAPLDSDVWLDQRHSSDFDVNFVRCRGRVGPPSDEETIALRERAFKAAFAATNGDSQIAAEVSDDFGLLADALNRGVHDDVWLNGVAEMYRQTTWPTGAVRPSQRSLIEILG